MIESLYLQNFRGIARAEIGLERLTVVVGPNASGKTSILQGLQYLSFAGKEPPEYFFQDRRDPSLLYRRNAAGEELQICGSNRGEWIRVRLVPPNNLDQSDSAPSVSWSNHREMTKLDRAGSVSWHPFHEFPPLFQPLKPVEILRFDASCLSAPANGSPHMELNGSGLASALTYLALKRPNDFLRLQQYLRQIVPSVEQIRFDRSSTSSLPSGFQETIIFDFKGIPDVPADLASEGTLLVLGLLTVIMSEPRPYLILLDDLDRALHPKAQREVVGLLRTVLDQNPELQIVATTHSPYLVDCLRPEEVRMTTLGDDGTVSCGSLVDHPDFDKWKDEMMPGEMWSVFGEKWVADLDKAPRAN